MQNNVMCAMQSQKVTFDEIELEYSEEHQMYFYPMPDTGLQTRLRLTIIYLPPKNLRMKIECKSYKLSLKDPIVTGKQIGRASCRERV